MSFTWQLRMCFQDVDAEGIVYHSRYLEYAERARTEWLHTMGHTNREIMDSGVVMVLRHIEMDFIAPAKLDDILSIDVRVVEIKSASTLLEQTISVDNQINVRLKLQLVFVDKNTLRPTRLPAMLKQIFEQEMKGE
ncbi:MAG: YbgC/FadM family acyl-CoA thioesterase [Alphaproteobacteria bacterium]|nr:YbgC/FadM family acyl-CoA thioesterase [Alphaproteobacteria bacterium]